jgi:SAM-dependent methyltransferase
MGARMETLLTGGGSAGHKAAGIVATFAAPWAGRVIDVGCRDGALARVLPDGCDYVGVDVVPAPDGSIVVADLNEVLPFEDRSADVLTAWDVLEHVDRIHAAFGELCRVSNDSVVISLPNCFDVKTRLSTARGRFGSAKRGLPVEPPSDRHHWSIPLADAQAFVRHQGRKHGYALVDERGLIGPIRNRVSWAVQRWPGLFAATYVAWLRREEIVAAS